MQNESSLEYFSTRWRLFWNVLKEAGWLQIFLYSIFLFIFLLVVQFIISLFGYCLTYQDASCESWGNYIFNVPLFGAIMTLIFGLFSRFGAMLTIIHKSSEMREVFGLEGDSITRPYVFLSHRGINTLFLPRYVFLVILTMIFKLLGSGWWDGALWSMVIVIVSNMQTINLFAQSQDKNESIKSDYVGKPATVNNTGKIIKRVLTITMWTVLIFFLLLIAILFMAAYGG